jgi:transposase
MLAKAVSTPDFCSMSFLKVECKSSGTYLRIIESYRDDQGRSRHRMVHSLGKVEDYTSEQLRQIGIRLYELGGGDIKALLEGNTEEAGRYNYGYYQIYRKAFKYYQLDHLMRRIAARWKVSFDLDSAVMLMLLERLQEPCSKRSNYANQLDYAGLEPVYLQHLYRALDKLAAENKLIQQQIFQTGRDLFNQTLDVVFYDVTTLYFESEKEVPNSLRQKGFSKDGKIGQTQILFCMLIDADKHPVGYQIFHGNTFEGHTLPHAIAQLKKDYNINKIIVVADRGMIGKGNIEAITDNGYEFIVGERLKNLPAEIQTKLLNKDNYAQTWVYDDATGEQITLQYYVTQYNNKTIIATYSENRAAKDKYEREQKLKIANTLLKNPSLIKKKASRYFIKQQSKDSYELDIEKIKQSEKYDGLLAISTNTANLSHQEVLEQYKQLFKIEHTFRTFKSHLETRPIFHWTNRRIEGHICLCYIAYTLQHWVLKKLSNFPIPITENILRKMLDSMQVSLIQHNDKKIYLRSAQQPYEAKLQQALGLKPLPPLIAKDSLTNYL